MVNIPGTNLPLRPATALALTRFGGGGRRVPSASDTHDRRRAMDLLLRDPTIDPEILEVVADDGTAIYTEARGPADGVPIVLSHGWSCHSRVWNAQINDLAQSHRVIVYDQRGHGRTPSGLSEPTIATLGDDLAAVVRAAVAGGQRAILVGHSMGGMTISAWAGRYPGLVSEQCRGVVLASTATDRLLNDFGVLPFPTRLPGAYAVGRVALSAPLAAGLLPAWGFQYASMGGGSTRAQVAFSRAIVGSCRARNRGRWGVALSDVDVRVGLAAITAPTTVIVGSADRLTPAVHSERMAEMLRATGALERYVVLDGAGHMTPVEAPFEFNAELRHLVEVTS
ncbi:alpha/beta fold hydrolase [Tomitella biformata]|uniref:alpha/beta fold hydrolase n=1 Tax=Tomitella biformata TaxID=630403 RepID=UPI00046511C6|nr:alpha/beta hydrolase [Tomitella biformata]